MPSFPGFSICSSVSACFSAYFCVLICKAKLQALFELISSKAQLLNQGSLFFLPMHLSPFS